LRRTFHLQNQWASKKTAHSAYDLSKAAQKDADEVSDTTKASLK
jgi:hypothetical protein